LQVLVKWVGIIKQRLSSKDAGILIVFQKPLAFPTHQPAAENNGRCGAVAGDSDDALLEIKPFHRNPPFNRSLQDIV
jgi:hypothetical protein